MLVHDSLEDQVPVVKDIVERGADAINDLSLLLAAGHCGLHEVSSILLESSDEHLQRLLPDFPLIADRVVLIGEIQKRIQSGQRYDRCAFLWENLGSLHQSTILAADLRCEVSHLLAQVTFADWARYARGQCPGGLRTIIDTLLKIWCKRRKGLLNVTDTTGCDLSNPFVEALVKGDGSSVNPFVVLSTFLHAVSAACIGPPQSHHTLQQLRILQTRWDGACRDNDMQTWDRLSQGLDFWRDWRIRGHSDSAMFMKALTLRQERLDSMASVLLPAVNANAVQTLTSHVHRWDELVLDIAECLVHGAICGSVMELWMLMHFYLGNTFGWTAIARGMSNAGCLPAALQGLHNWEHPDKSTMTMVQRTDSDTSVPFYLPRMLECPFLGTPEDVLQSAREQIALAAASAISTKPPDEWQICLARVQMECLAQRLAASAIQGSVSETATSINSSLMSEANNLQVGPMSFGSDNSGWSPKRGVLERLRSKISVAGLRTATYES